jgi:hypothetical protein
MDKSTVLCSLEARRVRSLCDLQRAGKSTHRPHGGIQGTYASPFWYFVNTFAISSLMRGKDGVFILWVHLMLFG